MILWFYDSVIVRAVIWQDTHCSGHRSFIGHSDTVSQSVYWSPGLISIWQQELSSCSRQTPPIKSLSASQAQGGKGDFQILSACLIHVGGSGLTAGEAKGFRLLCVMGEFFLLQPRDFKEKKPGFAPFLNVKCIMTHPHSSFFLQALFLSHSWNTNYVVGFSLARASYSDPCIVWVWKPPTLLSSTGRQRRARPRRRERRKRQWRTEGKRRTSWIPRHPRCPSESAKPALGDPWVPCSDECMNQDTA